MKAVILYANGFEDVEAIATRDVLVRAGIDVVDLLTENIYEDHEVKSSHGLFLDGFFKACNYMGDFDALILPGGGLGVKNLLDSVETKRLLDKAFKENKLVCAICAAPMVLGKYGYLKGKKYTCFAGCNEGINGEFTAEEVVVDGNIITARSMLYSIPFGLMIIERLLGKSVSEKVYKQIEGLNRK